MTEWKKGGKVKIYSNVFYKNSYLETLVYDSWWYNLAFFSPFCCASFYWASQRLSFFFFSFLVFLCYFLSFYFKFLLTCKFFYRVRMNAWKSKYMCPWTTCHLKTKIKLWHSGIHLYSVKNLQMSIFWRERKKHLYHFVVLLLSVKSDLLETTEKEISRNHHSKTFQGIDCI